MIDVVSPEVRGRMMAGIRGKNTTPEKLIRSQLHRLGYRFRIHSTALPGKPDLVLTRYKAVIFVHRCYWHCHECHLFKWPKTRTEFWKSKLTRNRENDRKVINALLKSQWRVCIVWECMLKGKTIDLELVLQQLDDWLKSETSFLEISA